MSIEENNLKIGVLIYGVPAIRNVYATIREAHARAVKEQDFEFAVECREAGQALISQLTLAECRLKRETKQAAEMAKIKPTEYTVSYAIDSDGEKKSAEVPPDNVARPKIAMNTTVFDLGLPSAVVNRLKGHMNIHTVGELIDQTEHDLLGFHLVGPRFVEHVKNRLAEFGLKLKEEA